MMCIQAGETRAAAKGDVFSCFVVVCFFSDSSASFLSRFIVGMHGIIGSSICLN